MILSNVKIVEAIERELISIAPLPHLRPGDASFNTSAIDLTLGDEILVPREGANITFALREKFSPDFLERNWHSVTITEDQPFKLKPNVLVLGRTAERVRFPVISDGPTYSARVEGRSSHARLGLVVHLTAPTIHANFQGTITLEMVNLGPYPLELTPNIKICQLIIETVEGTPEFTSSQFRGQCAPQGRNG
ncbi:MAG: dCTP deaminase [Candidatus Eremiobacteraeota bacterium]|nr:dCTP deaminase [Candidatus Eremiobacteraeota bacterium]